MASFDTKFLDLIISSLETIDQFTVVGNATLVKPPNLKINLAKLKLMKAQYLKFTTEYEKNTAEILKKMNEATDNQK